MPKSLGTTGTKTVRVKTTSETDYLSIPAGFCNQKERVLLKKIIHNENAEKFSDNDLYSLLNYVQLLLLLQETKAIIDDKGLILEDDNGKSYKSPAVGLYSELTGRVNSWASKLQLNPSARNRTSIQDPARNAGGETKLMKLINGGY